MYLGLALVLSIGCTDHRFCNDAMACEGGNEADYSTCVAWFNFKLKEAEAYGCNRAWEACFTCLTEDSQCDSGFYEDTCSSCDAYYSCVQSGSDLWYL
jgi:hypothetical protein